jgi:succinyl-CoA synthetase alpha subunit/RimJ/RimL family protein N-acetyltransferase
MTPRSTSLTSVGSPNLAPVRPRYVCPPYQDAADSGRLILRDGTTAQIGRARADDLDALHAFYEGLSPLSRFHRFFSAARPSRELISSLCRSDEPTQGMTLIVTRRDAGTSRIIASGSYLAKDGRTAEVAFAVDDAFHGKGLGTLLLERLALLAVRHGFTRFWAITHADNRAMRDVFRESGYGPQEKFDQGEIEVDFCVVPSATSVARLEMHDRVATAASLRPFFRPNGVVVVGVSRNSQSIGRRILDGLIGNGFQGPIYAINPNGTNIGGVPSFSSVRDLPQPVDLAVVAVPAEAVSPVVDDCAARGVRALVVVTAGFAETGAEGRERQRRLVEQVRGYGLRLIGPNCLGILNADLQVRLNASFSPIFPPPGRVAMSSQSGALGLAVLAAARHSSIGLSTFVSVGNKADVSGNDLLQYWEEDENTDVILLYLESFGNPRRFARIARRVSRRKPIVAIKSGRTAAGGRAASSHTAAMAAGDAPVTALFRQTGVIRAETLEEMFDLALALGCQPLPQGPRVAVVTNAGGPGILCADACEAGGLKVPELSPPLRAQLAAFLPAAASAANPIDLIASATPEQFRLAVEAVLSSGEVDALIAIYISVGLAETTKVTEAMAAGVAGARAVGAPPQPVLLCVMT